MKLTEKQWDVLSELALKRMHNCESIHRAFFSDGRAPETGWFMPMEFGGTDGSYHSGTATALAKKGLIDRLKSGRLNYFKSRIKGACLYRITDSGMEVYEQERNRRKAERESRGYL